MKSNLLDNEAAKAAAKRIYQKVNFSGGALQSYEISTLLTDTYEYLKMRNCSSMQLLSQPLAILRPIPRSSTSTKTGRSPSAIWKT